MEQLTAKLMGELRENPTEKTMEKSKEKLMAIVLVSLMEN